MWLEHVRQYRADYDEAVLKGAAEEVRKLDEWFKKEHRILHAHSVLCTTTELMAKATNVATR